MRDYDPTLGRYLQADPLGLVDGASIYGYALQNPGRYTDPRGEDVDAFMTALPAVGAMCLVDGPLPIAEAIGAATLVYLLFAPTEACGCNNCPSPSEAASLARQRGAQLTAESKASGIGTGAGRSGGHGTPFKRAGAQLVREANQQSCPSLKAAFRTEGNRLINRGKGTNHR